MNKQNNQPNRLLAAAVEKTNQKIPPPPIGVHYSPISQQNHKVLMKRYDGSFLLSEVNT